jgi:hypothetical protein
MATTKKKTTKKTTKKASTGAAAVLKTLIEEKSKLPPLIREQMGGASPAADTMESRIRFAQDALDSGVATRIEKYVGVLEAMQYKHGTR